MGKSKILIEKRSFLKNAGLYPVKSPDKIPTPEPSPESTLEPAVFDISKRTNGRAKKSQSKLHGEKNDEKNINAGIFNQYFKYQNPFFLKDSYKANKTRNENTVNHVNDVLFDLRNAGNKKETPEN